MHTIKAENLHLEYPIIGIDPRSLRRKVLHATTGGRIFSEQKLPVVNALQDISFECETGDRVGIVGHNGAGKSTLLRILAGIYQPTSGNLEVLGKVLPVLNPMVGMEMEATGQENAITLAMLLGASKKEALKLIDEITTCSGLGKYMYMPLRSYSDGMKARLAFATVTSMKADILLLDEMIGTGDFKMIKQAEERLRLFLRRSGILFIASHNEAVLRKFCNKGILLQEGRLLYYGAISTALKKYHQ